MARGVAQCIVSPCWGGWATVQIGRESRQVGDRMQEASGKAFWQKADARGAPVPEAPPYPVRDGTYVVSGSAEECIHAAMQRRSKVSARGFA